VFWLIDETIKVDYEYIWSGIEIVFFKLNIWNNIFLKKLFLISLHENNSKNQKLNLKI